MQLRLAETFAPVLVFHPSEEYFPISPLAAIDGRTIGRGPDDASLVSLLGTAASRREHYQALTREEKAGLATVYYRVYASQRESQKTIVVEYWLYYVQNTYRVRGNLFPFWVDGSHPNDLEHIHVVLRQAGDSGFVLDEVYASAHEGTMPANRYTYADDAVQKGGRFLVELGSHAMAPDIDGDGIFRPGVDGDSGYKLLWGIRDRGITWARYRQSYMDVRSAAGATVLEHAGADLPIDGRLSYRLVPVDDLRLAFARLEMTDSQRDEVFETDRHWFRRVFGGDNGTSDKLVLPPVRDRRPTSIGVERFAATERGVLLGAIFNRGKSGGYLGARYAYLHGIKYVPDVVFQADGVVTAHAEYLSTQVLASYPIDGSMKLMAGRGLITDSFRFDNRQWDWIAALEIRLGRMRFYASVRSWGAITQDSNEFRMSYFF